MAARRMSKKAARAESLAISAIAKLLQSSEITDTKKADMALGLLEYAEARERIRNTKDRIEVDTDTRSRNRPLERPGGLTAQQILERAKQRSENTQ